jgi:F-type H+-transporting ATPase subunit b
VTELLHNLAATEEAGGISALGLDPLALLAQAATFILLFWLVKKFALNKIVDTLEKRRKTIDAGITLGEQMQAEKEKLATRVEEAMAKAREEADKIIAAAKEESALMLADAEEKAVQKTAAMLAGAQARITEDINKARIELEKEMVSLVADATEILLREKLSAARDNELIIKSLQEARRE